MLNSAAALLGFLIGLLAVGVAMRVRRDLAAQLGREWRVRFLVVQGGLINACLFGVWRYLAGNLGFDGPEAVWLVSLAYGPLFTLYSLSNIDWTARKFHGVDR